MQYVRQKMIDVMPAINGVDIDVTAKTSDEIIDDYDYPLAGTLIKCDDPFEPITVDDWDVYQ